ncbi:MAG: hypothetical protein LBM93_03305, partial [Oscillospiraceae bacterium]|nr:hypothetical protein [Oscillospiraceae bacterium]
CKFTLNRRTDPSTAEIEYITRDDTTFYVMRDGEYTGLYARYNEFEKEERLFPAWKTLKEHGLLG